MLNSLFGDLPPPHLPASTPSTRPAAPEGPAGSAAVAVAPTTTDLLVDGSTAEAVRRHFAEHRQDLRNASAMVTLLDPSRLWASQVVHALSDAAGQPVQRLNLRERSTLRTLAVVERTLVPRRGAQALRVYHAEQRADNVLPGLDPEAIGNALAEGSQLTAVIVGTLQPHALVALLRALLDATRQPEWRCPWLVFILPPAAAALRQRILDQPWPAAVRVSAVAEPLASAASVWNCVLGAWEAIQGEALLVGHAAERLRRRDPERLQPPPGASVATGTDPTAARPADSGPPVTPPPLALNRLLLPLARSEGLLACGIVDLARGDLLASQTHESGPDDLPGLTLALCAARRAHLVAGGGHHAPDEILITAGPHQALLRVLPGDGSLAFVALLERAQANLSLLRFKLLDAERLLA